VTGDTSVQTSALGKSKPFSLADFRHLRWLEGRWKGTLPQGGYFYEQYRSLDDSTIAMHAFADSTFTRATDSARLTLRNAVIANEGIGARWVATRIDSAFVDFVPRVGATNGLSWARESPNRWTATLHGADSAGRTQRTVYPMERVGGAGS
jgi:hypothetical protein